MNYVDRLLEAYRQQLRQSTRANASGGERTWFLVIDPDKLRSVLARQQEFQLETVTAQRKWEIVDLTQTFGEWMHTHRYKDRYFKRPQLATSIETDFAAHLASMLKREIDARAMDQSTVMVLTGVEAIYGINKLSDIARRIEDDLRGNLLVFFPGHYQDGQYRFFDARDGWNYLAVPILPVAGKALA